MVDAYNAVTYTPSPQGQSISAASVQPTLVTRRELDPGDRRHVPGVWRHPDQLRHGALQRDPRPRPRPDRPGLLCGLDQHGRLTRQDVIDQLQGTDEAKRTEVARWYQTELNWDEPIADLKVNSGVEYWAGMIDGGLSDDVVHAMILSDGLAPGQSATAYVTALYQAALGRAPDPTGLAYYAGQIDQGVSRYDVALGLLTTDEGAAHLDRPLLPVRAGLDRHGGGPQGQFGRRSTGPASSTTDNVLS